MAESVALNERVIMPIDYYKGLSVAYALALEKSREASKVYSAAVQEFRSHKIGDEEFLAAQSAYRKAESEFDAAYAKEIS